MEALIIAFSMYSRIPMPNVEWNEKNTKSVMLFLPLVGSVLGILSVGLLLAARRLAIGELPTALLFVALYIFYTGGIHLDGFADTADARHSYLGKEERRRILADPHIGAFGVIRLFLFFVLAIAGVLLVLEKMPEGRLLNFAFIIPVSARMLVSFAVAYLPAARKEGLYYTFSGERNGIPLKAAAIVEMLILSVLALYELGWIGAGILIYYIIIYFFAKRFSMEDFGGMSGDLSGWLLCVAELGALYAGIAAGFAGLR